MKKITAILSLFIISSLFCLKAQDDNELTNRHELKLNLATSVYLAFPEVSYEYILSEDMSLGAALGFSVDKGDSGYSFLATPFFRWFFSRSMQQPGAGFFIEANAAMGTHDVYNYNPPMEESMFTAGLGMAIGWKYLSKNNWVGDLFFGAGRNFIYDKKYDDVSIYPRLGISIGKRF